MTDFVSPTGHQASVHAGRQTDPTDPYRDASGLHAGGTEDHRGHRRLAEELQIPQCVFELL